MDLKFSFGGASSDHGHGSDDHSADDHGDAPSGIPLPFAGAAPISHSSELDVLVRLDESGAEPLVVAEVVTGDGVTYSRGDVAAGQDAVDPSSPAHPAALAKAVRSAISRAVAGLEGPLAGSITSIKLQLAGGAVALQELGAEGPAPAVTDALQARLGVNTGVPIVVRA